MTDLGASGVIVRPLHLDDLPFAAALHREALPDGFFVALGDRFLQRYYEAFLSSPDAVGLVATVGDERRGVLVGTVDHGRHYRWIVQRRRTTLAMSAVGALARRPRLAVEFLRTRAGRYARAALRLRRRQPTVASPQAGPITGHLTHIAVVPQSRENGVGSALVQEYVDAATTGGARRLRVATKADGGAADFYRRLGWRDAGTMNNLDGVTFDVLLLDR